MKKFTITNSQNEKIVVDLIRYFKFQNNCYLIYTMNEVDEKNYLKLYLVRIMEELGLPIVQLIKNENDWAGMQNIIKKVIKEIKCEKYNYLEDLDYKTIDGIKITDARFFKLDPKLTNILSSNYFDDEPYNPSSNDDANSIGDGENNNKITEYSEDLLNIPVDTIIAENSLNNNDYVQNDNNMIDTNNVNDLINNNKVTKMNNIENIETNFIQDESSNNEILVNSLTNTIIEETTDVNKPIENNSKDITLINENISNNVEEQTTVLNNGLVTDNNIDIIVSYDNIDYKDLYYTVKKELDVSNQLTDDLLEKLLKYKEVYGELE